MKYLVLFLLAAGFGFAAADPSIEALAKEAKKAQNSGQLVRAYLLFAEASARDPKNESYRVNRDGLRPLAKLLSKAGLEKEPTRDELLASVPPDVDEPVQDLDLLERLRIANSSQFPSSPSLQVFTISICTVTSAPSSKQWRMRSA